MNHVFVSYVQENRDQVRTLVHDLQTRGIKVWWDQDSLKPGSLWKTKVQQAIQQGEFFIACFSREYANKQATHMNEELVLAIEKLRTHPADRSWFIPVLLNECVIPDRAIGAGLTLRDLQAAPLFADWEKVMQAIVSLVSPGYTQAHGFRNFTIGNIEIPVMCLVGTPQSPFSDAEVEIEVQAVQGSSNLTSMPLHHELPGYPIALKHLIEETAKAYVANGTWKSKYTNQRLPRLIGLEQGGERDNEDIRGHLHLTLGVTDFLTFLCTNRSLKNPEIREAFLRFPYNLETSPLANPLSSHIVVISNSEKQNPKRQIVVQWRQQVASYVACYIDSAAGYMSISHKDDAGVPSPFVTAVREAHQEISDRLLLKPGQYFLIGIAVNYEDMDLNAFGFAETPLTVKELTSAPRRDNEGDPIALPFEPLYLLEHIVKFRWEPISAFNVCMTLLSHFPPEAVEQAALSVGKKGPEEFLESDEGV